MILECESCYYKTEIPDKIFKCDQCGFGVCDLCSYYCEICSYNLCSNCVVIQGLNDEYDYLCKECDIEQHNNNIEVSS